MLDYVLDGDKLTGYKLIPHPLFLRVHEGGVFTITRYMEHRIGGRVKIIMRLHKSTPVHLNTL